jgi:alpha-glucosidase
MPARAGAVVDAPAPLERIPLFVPAGAIIPTTDSADLRRKHDEPSRMLRVFPGQGRGSSSFTLYEDDGATHAYTKDQFARVEVGMEWTSTRIRLHAAVSGDYALPYRAMRVMVPPGESRRIEFSGTDIGLAIAKP